MENTHEIAGGMPGSFVCKIDGYTRAQAIVHDMLWMSRANRRQLGVEAVLFRVIIQGAGRQKYHTFKLVVGPGDQGEPVITIMMADEPVLPLMAIGACI